MRPALSRLVVHLAVAVLATVVLWVLLRIAGYVLNPVVPLGVLLVLSVAVWLIRTGIEVAYPVQTPRLDTDPASGTPYSGDVTVRRLEDMMYAAQPQHRMTSRALGQMLGDAAEEHDDHEHAPALPGDLRHLITESRAQDPEAHPVPAVDRRTLHRYLRLLADTGPTQAAAPTASATSTASVADQEDRP
jgi:hypothetical protein